MPKSVKKSLAPSAEFLSRNKSRYPFRVQREIYAASSARHFSLAARAIASVFAVFRCHDSVAVYADNANVSADSPLYPLKRLNESVQLVLFESRDKRNYR